MTKHRIVLVTASLLALFAPTPLARADIFKWEYINPANPGLGKQPSTTLTPDGAGANAAPGAYLAHRNLTMAYLIGTDLSADVVADFEGNVIDYTVADLTGANLSGAYAQGVSLAFAKLIGANLSQANLTNVNFWGYPYWAIPTGADLTNANLSGADARGSDFWAATLTGANFTDAQVRGASFIFSQITKAQLYSTASYQAHDLTGIKLSGNYATINLAGQTLTNATFYIATLSGANLSQANLTSADFSSYTTGVADLTGGNLSQANLTNVNFRGFEWEEGIFPGANLTNANLSAADARGANFDFATLSGANTSNLIQSNGHIAGLDLTAGASLVVRDYDGNPAAVPPTGPLPIVVDQHLAIDATGTLRLVFDADPWDSTISFAPGIQVALAGTVDLTFAPGVDVATQSGRTIDLFDWTRVTPTGTFTLSSPYAWDLSKLYTTGEVTLTALSALPGDFNGNGTVDATDYVVWRNGLGTIYTQTDYNVWRAHFGASLGAGSGSAGYPLGASDQPLSAAVPEPVSWMLFCLGTISVLVRRRFDPFGIASTFRSMIVEVEKQRRPF